MAEERSRSRTYVWNEPKELARSVRPLSGLQFMEAWSRGEVTAPFQATIAFELSSFGDGEVELTCTPDEFHFNPYGTVHGGLVASLLDTATGCAIHTRLPAGTGYATLNLAVNYLRPVTIETGTVRCVGRVVSMGRTVAVSEGEVIDGSDRVLARATSTCILLTSEAG
jgi:uncharacterized protein (TIGR00369 family)